MKAVSKQDSHGSVWFNCPGCKTKHKVETKGATTWNWNGSLEKPTFEPSILVTWDDGEEHAPKRCHSFVREGQIQFLGDCTHELANQTVPLPEW